METRNIDGIRPVMPCIQPLRNPEPETVHSTDILPPPRGTRGPVRLGELIAPLQRIIEHPNRDNLLADFVRQCEAE